MDPEGTDPAQDGEHTDTARPVEDLAVAVPLAAIPLLAVALVALMWFSFDGDRVLVSVGPFAALLAVITIIDLRELRVPNRLLGPAALVAPLLLIIASSSAWPDLSLGRALLGALAFGGFYFLILMIYPPGMGWGDVKLAPLLGVQLGLFGWIPLVRAIIVAHLASGVVAIMIVIVGAVARGRFRFNAAFPFAPFMAIGALTALAIEGSL